MAAISTPTWLITGTSNGLGLSLAQLVLQRGHNLISLSRHPRPHERLIAISQNQSHPRQDVQLYHLQHDLGDNRETKLKSLVADFLSSHPNLSINYLVNNAAITAFAPVETIPTSTIEKVMTINFYSPLWLTQACLPNMRKSETDKKVIVNVSSTQGLACDPSELAYDASKHALEAFSGVLAKEVAPWNIRVINANLGSFRSGFATSGDRAGMASAPKTKTGDDAVENEIWRAPYDDPEHPATARVNMVMKYANVPNAAKGDTEKGAQILFDAITQKKGSPADEALKKQREYIANSATKVNRVERLLIGSDGWPKIRAAADQLNFSIDSCQPVAKLSDAE